MLLLSEIRTALPGSELWGLTLILQIRVMNAEKYLNSLHPSEKASEYVADEIEKYTESILPAVIMIPGVSGNTGSGILGVRKSVEKAVGSDIIFND